MGEAANLCAIDGTYELFRAFYGAPSRTAPDGREVGATVSLARNLRALIHAGTFSHFAVAFDSVIESFRNSLFAGYKTGEGIDPQLYAQFPLVEEVTRALGVEVLCMHEFEADDGLATIAALFREDERVKQVVIASPDKDLTQCVQGKVTTWDRLRDKHYDTQAVIQKMGVPPNLIPDYLALVGDSADGIPGVPRWGARSAATVLSHFGQLEKIPRDASAWDIKVRGAAALAEQLAAHEQEVLLYRTLATLREDVPISSELETYAYRGANESLLVELGERLGATLRA